MNVAADPGLEASSNAHSSRRAAWRADDATKRRGQLRPTIEGASTELPPESLHPGDGALAIAFSAYAPPPASLFLEAAPHIPTPAALKMSREAGRAK
jgi:hypothetical protein